MAREDRGGSREYGDPRCRGCRTPLGSDFVRIGRKRWHKECAEKKPRARQEWAGNGWRRLGHWSDEEQATMEAHSE